MFPQKERVNKEFFTEIIKKGKVVHSDNLTLRYLDISGGNSGGNNRYSFVVSAKVAKSAVSRNLLKRRGRAIVKKYTGKIKPLHACVFFFKPGSAKLDFAGLEAEIVVILKKARLI